ncbi:uncharacterized protein LOC143066817 [Mytilus galloprovincialis]|uniref:uncharacterized protein LOC143066817 n=1 Tax=Mytilus galloprovincialis TaxID=29158 RepID=UPI003F7CB0FB
MQATYGRSNKRTCKHKSIKTTRCSTNKPLFITMKNCNGRKSCTVAANNRLYGDPCPGTHKYVNVMYSCKDKTPKCLRKCHRQAKCIRGKCVCNSGYKGDGIRSCTNIKVKKAPKCLRRCHRQAKCIRGKCVCKSGYKGDGIRSCTNIKVQTPKCRRKCHKKARCIKGKCVCKGKYKGDGVRSCKKVKRSAYIGCYRDDSKRILSKKVLKDKRMTVQKCQQFCGQKGFKYAGVEYGFECFCGNVLRKDRKQKESDCKTPCAGNKRQICGGTWRISIYTVAKTSKCRNKCHKKAKCRKGKCVCKAKYQGDGVKSCKKLKRSAYIGCYRDDSKRILAKKVLKDKRMTVQKCQQFCGQKGFKYAGVEYGFECFCGNVLRKDRKRKESDCKTPCAGNKRQICGGTWRISIYTVAKTSKCRNKCHKKAKCRRGQCVCKAKYQGDGVKSCKKLKNFYYGFECFCGNVLRKDRKRKESDCKTPCAGNKRQICGGTWRISIYTVAKTSKCRNKCHKKAKCRRGKCVCKAKYQGDGVKSCKKLKRSAYIGCYRDDSKRILSKKVLKDKRMTVQKCQQFCGQKGFKYAGVEYGFECFCGNVLRKDRKRKESDCKTPCAGNKRQICGGTWRISIYTVAKTSKCRNKCHKKAKCRRGKCVCKAKYQGDGVKSCKKLKRSAYIGCYRDDSKRILSKKVLKDKRMTVQKCQQFCGQKGFKYAGVEYGFECFCGNVLRKDRKRKESDCKTPCAGNKRQICGGTWRISIYTVAKTSKCRNKCHKKAKCRKGKCVCKAKYQGDGVKSCKKLKRSAYIGCYRDDSKRILSKKVLKDKRMTVQKCQQFCGQKGFKYAGVEYGFECFCGNVLRKDRKRKESDCKTPCAGNKRQICGGTWRISIYTVAKTSKCRNKCHKKAKCRKGKCVCKAKYQGDGVKSCKKLKRSAYIGCYRDDSKRILSKKVLKDKRMTVQKCQQFCGQKGFKYAGVEYGFECFCGNVLRKDRKRKESDCKKPCAGNKRQICGGTWRISIYTAKTSKCRQNCHKKAKCRKGKCVCKRNYQGDGVKSCKKVKPSSNWKCYHYTLANKLAIKLFGEKSICEKHGRKFTKGINKRYPGCGTCWCCQKAKGKPPKCRNKCHKKAKCRKGKCVCRSKYQGDGVKSCKKGKKSAYIGCYQDHSKRILPKAVLKDKSMTVQKCRQFCGKKGFKYAGVEYGIECFCGDVLRKNKKRKESDCKMPCSGNKQQICGGTWRISIYTGKPGSCKGKCHKNGKCKKGRCRCKRGYTGDGINVCFKSCTCSASGDPHYRTFDGQMLHFMGTCKYTLSQYVNSKSTCRFHVQVRNENRGNKRVSYTRSVHVVVRNTKIDLLKNRGVKVDGVKRYLPYKTGYFSIINSGRYVRLKTTCNVIITWDGRSAATISVPSHFSQNLIGLCGNCNGIKDDFRTKDGLDVRTKRDKFTLIGESYLIREGKDEKCGVSAPPDPCTPTLRNKATRNTVCGRLNPANYRSPFRDCSQEDMALVQDIYDSCIYDYCAYNDQPDMLNTIVCEAAEGLEERCENMGFDISWRTKQFCPFTCEDNMEYSSSVSGCPATCVDLDAPKTCKLPPSEGCQCKKGFVLSDNTCIPRAQCGCRLPTGDYYPIDTEITSRDCRTVSKCVAKKGYAKMQVIKRQRCHRNAQCKLLNGVYDCACEEGFKGDGIKKCKGKPEPGIEKVICEGLKGSISCPRKKTIRILEATYGRTDMSTCKDPRVKTTSCSSNKPLPIIRKNCDGIKSCMVSANNGLYGDPCGGTYKYVTVRYVCEETGPKCGSSVCHPDAKCHRGRCVCRKGFVGDGVNSCTGTCTCIASGDPHYKSFDGQVIHFMGICTYTMVKSTSNDKCGGFEVQVQNEHRGANTKVSYTQYVLVKLADATIRLDKKNVVFVNDVQVYTPYSCTNFEITTSGRYVRLQTKCNILITWNGAGTVAVSVPKSYSGIVSGLCGDCNGKKDDFRTATGEDVSLKKDKFELIGQSYTVPGIYETKDKKCLVGPVPEDPCSAEESKKAASDKYCGLLNPKNYKSPFMSCAKKDIDMANGLYESCLYDYCSLVGSPELERIICESLEGYEEQCEDMGLSITWRRKDFCPLTCPENMEYSTSGSGCPATCVDPDAPLTCRLPNTEGCQCKAGFFLSGNECVPKEQCGCRGPEGEYYPLGKQFTSSDCTIVTKCSSVHGKPPLTVVKNQICHQNAKCRLRRGQYRCICKRKFKGNGVDVCSPKTPCKPKCQKGFVCNFLGKCRPKGCKRKCRINERCVRGKCRCKKGSYRTKLGACRRKTPCKPKCQKGFVCNFLGKCRPKGCKRKCRINERCVRGKCRCKKGSYRTKLGTCRRKTPCKRKCRKGFVCNFLGKCRPKGCKRKCRINERCVRGKCRCKKGSYRTKLAACRRKTPCKPKCQKGFVCNFLGKCRPKGCKRKCRINERCVRGKCRCKKGSYRTKLGTCRRKTPCKRKCRKGFVCNFLGKCRPKGCKRKCRINERCVRGKCRCKKGSYRTKLGACRRKTPCKRKCRKGFVCNFLGKCRPKGCKRKCRINERCVRGKCRCKKGSYRTKLGTCRRKTPCKRKCRKGFVCNFLGKCRPKGCKRKCRINERCVRGKCRCKKGSYRTKLGTCRRKTPCKRKCRKGFVCNFLGKCRPKGCKRKCRINERCVRGKCRCKKGSYRTNLGTCRRKTPCKPKCQKGFVCNFLGKCRPKGCKRKCRINERCVRGKCRCKKGSYRTKLGTCRRKTPCKRKCRKGFVCNFLGKCRPKGCKRKCRINERCVRGKCRCKKGSYRTKLGTCRRKTPCKRKCRKGFVCNFLGKCRPKGCKRKCRINERCVRGKCRCKKGSYRTHLGTCRRKTPCKRKCRKGFVCNFLGKCRPKGKTPCKRKCRKGFVCNFLGKCRPKGCKRKCRINERCVRGKCRCKKGSYRTKLGTCRRKTPCKRKCRKGFVCNFLGKCRPKAKTPCKPKCQKGFVCNFLGKCRPKGIFSVRY